MSRAIVIGTILVAIIIAASPWLNLSVLSHGGSIIVTHDGVNNQTYASDNIISDDGHCIVFVDGFNVKHKFCGHYDVQTSQTAKP